MPREPIGSCVETPRCRRRLFSVLELRIRVHRHVVPKRDQSAISARAEADVLVGRRSDAGELKNLLPSERDLDRSLNGSSAEDGEGRLEMHAELGAEATAGERTHETHVRGISAQSA